MAQYNYFTALSRSVPHQVTGNDHGGRDRDSLFVRAERGESTKYAAIPVGYLGVISTNYLRYNSEHKLFVTPRGFSVLYEKELRTLLTEGSYNDGRYQFTLVTDEAEVAKIPDAIDEEEKREEAAWEAKRLRDEVTKGLTDLGFTPEEAEALRTGRAPQGC